MKKFLLRIVMTLAVGTVCLSATATELTEALSVISTNPYSLNTKL